MPVLARLTAAALLIMLTACANSGTTPPSSAPLPAATTHMPRPTPATTSAQTPAAGTQTPAAGPQAADGHDLASCEDADCEVEVQIGDRLAIDKRFGVQRLTVSSLQPDEVGLALSGSSGGMRAEGMSVSVSSSCVNGRCRDEGKLSLAPGRPGSINTMRLELTHLSGDRAILRLTPR